MKDIKKAIEMQLAVAKEINSDFITLGTGKGKRILKLLKEQEAVVRCKDCKHWEPEHKGHCPYNHIYTVPDWFCADGERRD